MLRGGLCQLIFLYLILKNQGPNTKPPALEVVSYFILPYTPPFCLGDDKGSDRDYRCVGHVDYFNKWVR